MVLADKLSGWGNIRLGVTFGGILKAGLRYSITTAVAPQQIHPTYWAAYVPEPSDVPKTTENREPL